MNTKMGFVCVAAVSTLMLFFSLADGNCPCAAPKFCNPIIETLRKEVMMFSLHDTPTTWMKFNYTKVTTIVMVGYISPKLMCYAHERNTRVVIIANYPTANLTDPNKRQAWVHQQLTTVQSNYLDGINIDFESPITNDQVDLKNGYTSLVNETYQAFKKALPYSQVTVDVAWSPACIDSRCYDYKALALVTDFLFVMAYDEQSQIIGECIAMANSGYQKTWAGVKGYQHMVGVDLDKLVLGLPWYGYKYKCLQLFQNNTCTIQKVPFRGVNCSDAAGTQVDYRNIMKLLQGPGTQMMFDNKTMSPYINYEDPTSKEMYQIWYDDPRSLGIKYDMAIILGLRGVGIWNADSLDYTNTSQITSMWDAFPYTHH